MEAYCWSWRFTRRVHRLDTLRFSVRHYFPVLPIRLSRKIWYQEKIPLFSWIIKVCWCLLWQASLRLGCSNYFWLCLVDVGTYRGDNGCNVYGTVHGGTSHGFTRGRSIEVRSWNVAFGRFDIRLLGCWLSLRRSLDVFDEVILLEGRRDCGSVLCLGLGAQGYLSAWICQPSSAILYICTTISGLWCIALGADTRYSFYTGTILGCVFQSAVLLWSQSFEGH